jgi:hypothetical protein
MSQIKIGSINKDSHNKDIITILSEPTDCFTGLYPCINGFDPKLPKSRILLLQSYVDKNNININRKIFQKKNSKKKRYQWYITIKYTKKQWNHLINWKKEFIFDIFLTGLKQTSKKTIIPYIPVVISNTPIIISNDDFLGIHQSSFNCGAIQSKKINNNLFVLKIMLEDAAFF